MIEDDYLGLIYKIFIVKVIKENYSVTYKNDCFNIDTQQGKNKQKKVEEVKSKVKEISGKNNKNTNNSNKNTNKNTNYNSKYTNKHPQNDTKSNNHNKMHSTDLIIEISKTDIFI